MTVIKPVNVLGLLSTSSLEGVYVALLNTDGVDVFDYGRLQHIPYDEALREKIRPLLGTCPYTPEAVAEFQAVNRELTVFHAEIVKDYIAANGVEVDVIGYEGINLTNYASGGETGLLGDGKLLAELTGIRVVCNFHAADIRAGGQGAPLDPVYYNALCADIGKPLAVVNISGITRVTWIGSYGEMTAFDTGPGNAAIDEWVRKHGGMHMDYNGKLAITGKVNEQIVATMMRHKYFAKYPPKSTNRSEFVEKLEHLEGLSLEDGAATATAFVAESIAYSLLLYLPEIPKILIVCGGGAKSPLWKKILANVLQVELDSVASEQGPGLGGAMLAMVACGAFANVTEACQRLVRVSETVRPDPELAARYEARYQQFRNIYPACKALFPSLLDT